MDKEQLKKILIKADSLQKGKEIGLAKEFISLDEKIDTVKESVTSISEELKKKFEEELSYEVDEDKICESVLSKIVIPEPIKGEKGDSIKGDKGDSIKGEQGIAGRDGISPNPTEIVPLVIAKMPKVEPFVLERLDVVKTINTGKKKDLKIEASQIAGLELMHTDTLNRAVSILDQRTKFLINRQPTSNSGGGTVDTVVAGTGISVDSTDPANPIVTNSAPDQTVAITAGTNITSVTGTYPNFTINAATQTTDISGLVPYTGATGDVNLGTHALTVHNIKPDASDGLLLESNNGTDIGILGAANTANVTWYGSHNFDTATQDTIAAFTGVGKTLGSLATATYPSLTELSYVKGVTSAIQTQLGNKQALDATLTALAGLTIAADSLTIGTGTDAFSQTTFAANTFPARASTGSLAAKTITDYALTILDDVDASTARATLGLTIGTNVQAYDADLTTWAGITPGTGVGTALAVNTGSAGAVVVNGGALGTPSAGTLTNATGLPAASVVAGTFGTGAYTMDTSLTVPILNGSSAANGDITINGTSNATKTSSYVILQATGGNVGIGTTAPAAAFELASGGLYVSNYGSGVSVPGGGSIGMYLRGATSTSPFGFSAAGTGNISATAPLFYYSWVGASATKLGFSSYDASAIKDYIAFDYATGNFEVKAPAIEATSSTTIGTTTLADKFGNAYLTNGADIYPDNDVYGLWNRFVNYGFTPDEHWGQNADELTWTGWASYTSFVTPASITTNLSSYSVAHNNGVKSAFRYRSAATGAAIFLRARAAVTFLNTGGLMIDDGTDTGDGNGANNFYRVYIKQTTLGGAYQVFEEYRTGGGAVTTNTGPTIAYGQFSGIGLFTQGTRWTSWTAAPFTFGEAQSYVQFTGGSPSFTWTPARVGLYAKFSATDFGRRAVWDWYDEATS